MESHRSDSRNLRQLVASTIEPSNSVLAASDSVYVAEDVAWSSGFPFAVIAE
jgi:hypothetical protein